MGEDKREKKKSSPVPQELQKELANKESVPEQILMSFGDVLKVLVTNENSCARRIGWLEQGAPEDYITIRSGQLHVFTKGAMHTLTVSDGDISNEDWVIV